MTDLTGCCELVIALAQYALAALLVWLLARCLQAVL